MIQKCSIWNVFSEFAKNPKKDYQVRELSRQIKLAPTSIKLHLSELEKEGIVKKEKVGVYKAYKSNFENENFRFYKRIYNIISLKESGLVGELERRTTPDAIISILDSHDKSSSISFFPVAGEKSKRRLTGCQTSIFHLGPLIDSNTDEDNSRDDVRNDLEF